MLSSLKRSRRRFAIAAIGAMSCLIGFASPARSSDVEFFTKHPSKVVGNLFVLGKAEVHGDVGLAAFLIATDAGHILINGGLPSTPANKEQLSPALIRRQMQQLGLRYEDLKILLITHAHSSWFLGNEEIRRATGARVLVMEDDDEAVRTGATFCIDSPESRVNVRWGKPVPVDEVLHEGSVVELGGMRLIAHRTPGHRPGATTWEVNVTEDGRTYRVLILDSPLSYKPKPMLVLEPNGSTIPLQGLIKTQRVLRRLEPDITLESHEGGSRIDGQEAFRAFLDRQRLELLQAIQDQTLIATDPDEWQRYLKDWGDLCVREANDPKVKEQLPQIEVLSRP